jgi:hypothetical protein
VEDIRKRQTNITDLNLADRNDLFFLACVY